MAHVTMDFATARLNMVTGQVRTNDVTDPRIQEAMNDLPRELFVPPAVRPIAYSSETLPLGRGRYLLEPRSFAKLAHAARIQASDVVLVVGAGTGYSSAVLARLGSTVVALEEDENLAREAGANLRAVGTDNAAVVTGSLSRGYPEQGPYDVIFFDGAVEVLPESILAQLKDRGRLAVVVHEGPLGKARIYTRSGDAFGARIVFDATVPVLPGFAREKVFTL